MHDGNDYDDIFPCFIPSSSILSFPWGNKKVKILWNALSLLKIKLIGGCHGMGTSTSTLKLKLNDSYIPYTKCNPYPCHRSHLTSTGVPGGFLRGGAREGELGTEDADETLRDGSLQGAGASKPRVNRTAPGPDALCCPPPRRPRPSPDPPSRPPAAPRECWECESGPRRASAQSGRAGDPAERRSSSRASARLGTAAGAAPSAVSPARPRARLRPSERYPPLFPPSRPPAPPAPPPPAPARSRSGAGSGSSRPPGAKAT